MSALNVRLPESIHQRLRILSDKEGISINSFINAAVAEKISALDTETLLLERAKRGSKKLFSRILAKVPDVPPLPGDEL